jgi:hypothetical protein
MRLDNRLHRAAIGKTGIEIAHIADRVELIEIKLVPTEAIECAQQLLPGLGLAALLGLATDIDVRQWSPSQIVGEPQFRIAVRRRHIELIYAPLKRKIDQRIRFRLGNGSNGSQSKADD